MGKKMPDEDNQDDFRDSLTRFEDLSTDLGSDHAFWQEDSQDVEPAAG